MSENRKTGRGQTPPSDVLNLDRQLCFALYVSSKEMIGHYKPFLDPLHLTYTGYIVMLALWEQDDIPVKTLGARLTLDSGTLTPLLKKLEKLSYVRRCRSAQDERIVLIRLTPQGSALRERAEPIPERVFSSLNIDPENTRLLLDYLQRLTKYILKKSDA